MSKKIALVTGGIGGIGTAICRQLAKDGCTVVANYIAPEAEKAQAWLAEHRAAGYDVHIAEGDVSSFEACAAMGAKIKAEVGPVDILVNNAGIALPAATVQDTSFDEFEQLVAVNLRSVFLGCKLAHPHLKASRGCALNISSMAAVTGQERHAIYGATKGAINALTKCTAVDWGRDGIRINALCPAGVRTETLRQWMKSQPDAAGIETYLNQIHALGYCPEPSEIATVAAFLCSDEAKFITGYLMPVSGGSECGYNIHAPVSLADPQS